MRVINVLKGNLKLNRDDDENGSTIDVFRNFRNLLDGKVMISTVVKKCFDSSDVSSLNNYSSLFRTPILGYLVKL